MAKKYLTLEEAAETLGLAKDQLNRLRERGEIRGFADRGSWKFREEDIEEFRRSQQADSSPDFPIIPDEDAGSVLEDDQISDLSSSDSDVRLFFDESLFEDDDDLKKLKDSDSDVQLTGDSGPKLESAGENLAKTSTWEPSVDLTDSDSDVKLVGSRTDADIDLAELARTTSMSDSESMDDSAANLTVPGSGINLMDSDSDVRLTEKPVPSDEDDDDSGISLFDDLDSDSDVKLTGLDDLLNDDDADGSGLSRTDSDIRLMEDPVPARSERKPNAGILPPQDSDLKLIDSGSRVKNEEPDSGITLAARGSSLSLDADESGISLEIDSGISLEADDSGISLESFDSGASLDDDSGISLDAADSGISLELDDDSGISLNDGDDMGRTMPMGSVVGARALMEDSTDSTTQFELPTPKKASGRQGADDARTMAMDSVDETDAFEDVDADGGFEDDDYADDAYADDEFADDDMGDETYGDDEFEDEGGDEGFAPAAPGRSAARADLNWTTGTKVMLGIGSLLSVLCGLVGIELVRTMWLWTHTDGTKSPILEMIGGLFG